MAYIPNSTLIKSGTPGSLLQGIRFTNYKRREIDEITVDWEYWFGPVDTGQLVRTIRVVYTNKLRREVDTAGIV